MGKIHPNPIDSFDDDSIRQQKIKKRVRTESEDLPKQKPRNNKRR